MIVVSPVKRIVEWLKLTDIPVFSKPLRLCDNDSSTHVDAVLNATFTTGDYSVSESEGVVQVCVMLTGLIARNVIVDISTSNGSAKGM